MRECTNCGAAMLQDQDWCVQCGAARPGHLKRRPGWLTGAGVLAITMLLVAGASVAAYAALSKHEPKAHKQLALLHTPTAVPPSTTTPVTPGTTTPTIPPTPGTPTSPTGALPPKIPTQTPTPEGSSGGKGANELLFQPEGKGSKAGKSGKVGKSSKSNGSGGKGSSEGLTGGGVEEGSKGESSNGSGSKAGEPEGPEPILLDTNAASTYNPNTYLSSLFGDPSLTIDGDTSTAWTTEVQSSLAPQVNAGVVLDLRTAQKLGSATIETKTPGIAVEMYGANGHDLPALITDSTWKKLHGTRLLKKKKVTIKLKTKGAAYRFVLLWIVKGPASSTSADPGKVAISELELFPPK